jgi:hypothetical protein
MSNESKVSQAADTIVELEQEGGAAGVAAVTEPSLVLAREVMRAWIDEIKGVVVNTAMARVTVIDANGRSSSIAAADLAFRLSAAGITQAG